MPFLHSLTLLRKKVRHIDSMLFFSALFISLAGLITMNSFSEHNSYFHNQIIWILLSITVFFIFSFIDFRFLRQTNIIMILFLSTVAMLGAILLFGEVVKGAQSRFNLGFFAVQPADPAKIVIIALLSKYFARRHVEIAHIKHIIISGIYAFIIFALIAVQPDFGSAIMIAGIWFGMVLVSGLSKKHLLLVFAVGALSVGRNRM